MSNLTDQHCKPLPEGSPALSPDDVQKYLGQVDNWEVVEDGRKIHKAFTFPNFVKALEFVNAVGDLAEKEEHHPDILLTYGKAEITIWTHTVGGLSVNDFILAARIDTAQ